MPLSQSIKLVPNILDKTEREQKLQAVVDKIVKEYQPEKIILFGSWAWGEPHKWSDMDLFIVKESNKDPIERIRDVYRIIFGAGIPTDVLVYTPSQTQKRLKDGDPFLRRIFHSGKILYAK
jgi:uncharacterized protein